MALLPGINFRDIRSWGNPPSQAGGFEELVSQLMREGLIGFPTGTRFERFGNPDGGREGRALLPNGEIWAWQTKFFFQLDSAEFAAIGESIKRTLDREPTLTKYLVVLPYDRPAGDTARSKSAHTKWSEHVEKWTADAAAIGREVLFEYVGESELHHFLSQPDQVGRLRYWFDLDGFSLLDFERIAAECVASAGPRYTPELNVVLPLSEAFEGLGRTIGLQSLVREQLAALRRSRRNGFTIPDEHRDEFSDAITLADAALDHVDGLLETARDVALNPQINLPDVSVALQAAKTHLWTLARLLSEHSERDGFYYDKAASLHSRVREIASALQGIERFSRSRGWQHSSDSTLLIEGTGGSGKTHLLCDLASQRTQKGLPTLIALGEHFQSGSVEAELGRIVGFNGAASQLLATFSVACESLGEVGFIIIDALNESEDRRIWTRHLASFLDRARAFPNLRVVMSCRTEFLADTIPEHVLEKLASEVHEGFAEVADTAIVEFLGWYDIEVPSFPLLDLEFTNPLFLKLLCTALQRSGARSFPRTGLGLSWTYDILLESVNRTLSNPDRCDYDSEDALVQAAVRNIALAMRDQGRFLPRATASKIIETSLPDRSWSSSLLRGLLHEGIFTESQSSDGASIRFAYERLGDTAIARLICSADSVETIERCQKMASRWYSHAGELDALATILPEVHGVELLDAVKDTSNSIQYELSTGFLQSLAWRSRSALNERTREIALSLWKSEVYSHEAMTALLRVATIPDHATNALWLHDVLFDCGLPDRDATWTQYCNAEPGERAPLQKLISWAWSPAAKSADDDARLLTAHVLAWALVSSHRPTRDNATKALLSVLEAAPALVGTVLNAFRDVNDPYVEERLLAAACGLSLRTRETAAVFLVAEAVFDYTVGRGYWPVHIFSRDYARRVLDRALDLGWESPKTTLRDVVCPPYESKWPASVRSAEEIREMTGPPDYAYSTIGVMSSFDDFRKYVIDTSLRNVDLPADVDNGLVSRLIFDRVLDLGWTPERFLELDKAVSWQPSSENRIERIGKKYQWIAYFETLGRILDRYPLDSRSNDDKRTEYQRPIDVRAPDIDPSVLLKAQENRSFRDSEKSWFAPVSPEFPSYLDPQWPVDDASMPNIETLMMVTRPEDGTKWILLEGNFSWTQPLPPEEAALEPSRHQIWIQVDSYLIDAEKLPELLDWAANLDSQADVPTSSDPYGLFLADHPYGSAWPEVSTRDGWDRRRVPVPIEITTTNYSGTSGEWDQSESRHLSGIIPSTAICKLLGVAQLEEFRWGTRADGFIIENFSVRNEGPNTAHMKISSVVTMLQQHSKALFWTVRAAKETVERDYSLPRDGIPVRRTYLGFYSLDGSTFVSHPGRSETHHSGGGTVSSERAWPEKSVVIDDFPEA
ncbi:NACHT domain-containing protein [Paenarthrobacter sp. NPDC058040]|uniref:NACHT domain-containing protein n=1 Tax=unclassified Paenarthrobacter TaxID=2634190 RepID=UPI0036DC04FF